MLIWISCQLPACSKSVGIHSVLNMGRFSINCQIARLKNHDLWFKVTQYFPWNITGYCCSASLRGFMWVTAKISISKVSMLASYGYTALLTGQLSILLMLSIAAIQKKLFLLLLFYFCLIFFPPIITKRKLLVKRPFFERLFLPCERTLPICRWKIAKDQKCFIISLHWINADKPGRPFRCSIFFWQTAATSFLK